MAASTQMELWFQRFLQVISSKFGLFVLLTPAGS